MKNLNSKNLKISLLFSFIILLTNAYSQVNNPPWNLYGSGSNLTLENIPNTTKEINLYQNSGWRMSIKPYTISGGLGNYVIFPANNNTITYAPFFLTSHAKLTPVHFQSFSGSGLLSYASHSSDWGQNIISVVSRPNTISFVMNHNAKDRIYYTGSGYIAAEKGFWQFSDEALKNNVVTINEALNKVKAMRGVYFDFVEETDCDSCSLDSNFVPIGDFGTQMGLIAQEVEDIVPEVVRQEHNGYKAVAYANLVGLLIEAIKELDSKINQCCAYEAMSKKVDSSNKSSDLLKIEGDYFLSQNNPNPSNGSTIITYRIPQNKKESQIVIFDLQGKLIKSYKITDEINSSLTISKGELPLGMYYYSLIVEGKEIDTKKMILTN